MKWPKLAPLAALATPAVVVATAGAILAACAGSSSGAIGVLHPTGDVTVSGRTVHAVTSIRPNDLIEVDRGAAVLTLAGGHLEMRSGSIVRAGDVASLVSGSVLAESTANPMRISTEIADVTVHGTSRLSRDLALTVATYTGTATISAGRTVTLPALAQDTIPSVSVVPEPSPLRLDANDPWDQRLLGTAIDMSNQIDSQSRYADANVPSTAASSSAVLLQSFRKVDTGIAISDGMLRSATLGGGAPPIGDALAVMAIALSGPGDFATRWREAFDLRQAGAQWGIIVLEESANPARVLQLLEDAVNNATATEVIPATPAPVIAAPVVTPNASTPTPAVPSGPVTQLAGPILKPAPAPKPAPATAATPQPSSTPTTPPPATPPATTVPPSNTVLLGPVLNPIVDPLGHLLAGLLHAGS